jgi:hypothetical protein
MPIKESLIKLPLGDGASSIDDRRGAPGAAGILKCLQLNPDIKVITAMRIPMQLALVKWRPRVRI